jgi:hypothetical protein
MNRLWQDFFHAFRETQIQLVQQQGQPMEPSSMLTYQVQVNNAPITLSGRILVLVFDA